MKANCLQHPKPLVISTSCFPRAVFVWRNGFWRGVHGGDLQCCSSTQREGQSAVTPPPALFLGLDDQSNLLQVTHAPLSPSSAVMLQPLKSLSSTPTKKKSPKSRTSCAPTGLSHDEDLAREWNIWDGRNSTMLNCWPQDFNRIPGCTIQYFACPDESLTLPCSRTTGVWLGRRPVAAGKDPWLDWTARSRSCTSQQRHKGS